jgi:hypothetical protein
MVLTYPSVVRRNHALPGWPLRRFAVVEDSMRPALCQGDKLLAARGCRPRSGQLRVFRDPRRSDRWLVKRVGEVHTSTHGTIFEARSDNPGAAGAVDSHELGWIPAAGSYRVVWTLRTKVGP